MAREYDFTVLGATGFTGKYVCKELLKETAAKEIKVAIAGRSRKKLNDILDWLATGLDLTESQKSDVGVVVADVGNEESLIDMCKQSKIVLDCVGPYKFLGEPVVRACLAATTDYVDVTGEPEFMERIQQKYHEEAMSKGVYIVNACGFDCVPSEMGVIFAKQKFNGTLTSIENYFTMRTGPYGMKGNYGTYASMIHGFSDFASLRKVRKSAGHKRLPICGPKLKSKGIHRHNDSYGLPFAGADPSVVRRTQRYLLDKDREVPVQFMMYFSMRLLQMIGVIILVMIWYLLTQFSWGTKMLLKYPEFFSVGFFSRKGPSEKQMGSCYFDFLMYCKGFKKKFDADEMASMEKECPDSQMVVKITGPEIGYVLTPIVMVQSALCIRDERSILPSSGGVYTPGIAFGKANLIENLEKHDISFEVVSQ